MELKGFGGEGFKTESPKKNQKKISGRGGFLSSLISEGGATGGAISGGAAGAALGSIVPVLGTAVGGIIGAGVGGLAGGLGGSAVEQKVRDDKVDWKKAATEGLVSGATSVVPGAGKLAVTGAKNALTKSAERGAEEGASSLLSKLSNSATKSGSGLKVGQNVGDVNRLDQATDVFQKYKIAGTPTKQLRQINETMGKLGQQVDDTLAKNPIQLDGTAVKTQVQQALDDPLKYAELDLSTPGAQRTLGMHLEKYAGAKSAKEVNDYIKQLNPIAKRAQDKLMKGSALTDKETAALAAKKAGDDVLSQYPEIKPLKQDMATLFERNKEVAKLSEQKANLPVPFLNVQSRVAKQALAGAQSKAGTAVNSVDNANKSLFGQIARKGALQVGASTAMDGFQPGDKPVETAPAEDTTTLNPESSDQLGAGTPQDQLGMGGGTPGSNEAYSSTNLMADIQRDPKNASTYMSLYKLLAPEAGSKGLNSTASGVIADTKTGLKSLQNLAGQVGSNSANNPLIGRIRGSNPYDTNAQSLQAGIATAKQIVGKALEGGVLRKEDEVKYSKLLPTMGDTDANARNKISRLYGLISSRLNEYQSNISGGGGGVDAAALGI